MIEVGQLRVVKKGYTIPLYAYNPSLAWAYGRPWLATFGAKLLVTENHHDGKVWVYANGQRYWQFTSYLENYTLLA